MMLWAPRYSGVELKPTFKIPKENFVWKPSSRAAVARATAASLGAANGATSCLKVLGAVSKTHVVSHLPASAATSNLCCPFSLCSLLPFLSLLFALENSFQRRCPSCTHHFFFAHTKSCVSCPYPRPVTSSFWVKATAARFARLHWHFSRDLRLRT